MPKENAKRQCTKNKQLKTPTHFWGENILHYYVYIISVLLKYYTYGLIYIYNSNYNNIIYLELELKYTSLNIVTIKNIPDSR